MSLLRRSARVLARMLALAALAGCGGGGGAVTAPAAPAGLTADAGSEAVALGWRTPAADGGAPVEGYAVTAEPPVDAGSILVHGTTALAVGLANGTRYTFSVTARNRAGAGPAAAVAAAPAAYAAAGEAVLQIAGDASPSGIFDPSVLRARDGTAWLAYSSVDYHGAPLVQDVGIALARSDDGGATWRRVGAVAVPGPATVTDTVAGHPVCGAATCTGRWAHETAWLVEDPDDAPARRFKLFAHRYFLYPPAAAGQATVYVLGAIVRFTAATPDGLVGAAPEVALRWDLTPPELGPGGVNVNALAPELAGCLAVAEGGGAVRGGALDLALACPYAQAGASPLPQKIVLLRSVDHGAHFSYVSTLLDAPDAALLFPGASFYTAPSLLPGDDAAPVLVATPSFSGVYGGCVVIPFADVEAGSLDRIAGAPAVMLWVPTAAGTVGGACAVDRGVATGLLRNELAAGVFRIIRTGRAL